MSKFVGWVAKDETAVDGNMEWQYYDPKPFLETDIDIEVTHCGICSSDLSHLSSAWKPADYPIVVGHEIVGRVIKIGNAVSSVKIGDRVGVGAQCHSCLRSDCKRCCTNQEQHCPNEFTTTYDVRFPDGSKAYGGFARYWRGPAAFVVQVPDAIPSETAAPMLCGGLTVFTPLKENGAGPGKRVGIIGIGGLGHFGILFAKALNADKVVAISRSSVKKDDAVMMGADALIATGEEPDWPLAHAESLDLIISTVSGSGFELEKYLALLDTKGILIQVGAPKDPIPPFHASSLLRKDLKLGGSLIGSRSMAEDMLQLAAQADISAWVDTRPMSEANKAVLDMANGNARYRYVLTNSSENLT